MASYQLWRDTSKGLLERLKGCDRYDCNAQSLHQTHAHCIGREWSNHLCSRFVLYGSNGPYYCHNHLPQFRCFVPKCKFVKHRYINEPWVAAACPFHLSLHSIVSLFACILPQQSDLVFYILTFL